MPRDEMLEKSLPRPKGFVLKGGEIPMYISSFHIDGFGIFSNAGVSDLPPGMVIFLLARTRPAKSTCLEFIRTMLLAIRTGRWPKDLASLSMAVVRAEILFCASMARDPCRMKSGFHAGPEKAAAFFRFMRRTAPHQSRQVLSPHGWHHGRCLQGRIWFQPYRILENFACLNEEGVRNAPLYSASFGPGITAPGEVLKFLAAWQGKLFSPGGKKRASCSKI